MRARTGFQPTYSAYPLGERFAGSRRLIVYGESGIWSSRTVGPVDGVNPGEGMGV